MMFVLVIGGAAGVAAGNVDYGALPDWMNVGLAVFYVTIGLAALYGIARDMIEGRRRDDD